MKCLCFKDQVPHGVWGFQFVILTQHNTQHLPQKRWFSAHKETFPLYVIKSRRAEQAINGVFSSWYKAPGWQAYFQSPVKNQLSLCNETETWEELNTGQSEVEALGRLEIHKTAAVTQFALIYSCEFAPPPLKKTHPQIILRNNGNLFRKLPISGDNGVTDKAWGKGRRRRRWKCRIACLQNVEQDCLQPR